MLKKTLFFFFPIISLQQSLHATTYEYDKIIKGFNVYVYNYTSFNDLSGSNQIEKAPAQPCYHYLTLSYNSTPTKWRSYNISFYASCSVSERIFNLTKDGVHVKKEDQDPFFKINVLGLKKKTETYDVYLHEIKLHDNKNLEGENDMEVHDAIKECTFLHHNETKETMKFIKIKTSKNHQNHDDVTPSEYSGWFNVYTHYHKISLILFTPSTGVTISYKIHKELYLTCDVLLFISFPIAKKKKKFEKNEKKELEENEDITQNLSQESTSFYGISINLDVKFRLVSFLYMHFSPLKFDFFWPINEERGKDIMSKNMNTCINIGSFGLYF